LAQGFVRIESSFIQKEKILVFEKYLLYIDLCKCTGIRLTSPFFLIQICIRWL